MPAAPWDRLLDAQVEAAESLRTDDAGRQAAALEELEAAREEVACVGSLLILMALERGGLVVQKKLGAVFNGLAAGAWHKAQAAEKRADDALEELDVLRQRICELERRLERQRLPELVGNR